MGDISSAVKMSKEAIENALHLGKKVEPQLMEAVERFKPGLGARLESQGATESGSRMYGELKARFGTEDANAILKDAGYDGIQSTTGTGYKQALGMAALPAASAAQGVDSPLDMIKSGFGKYNDAKNAVAGALAKETDLTPGGAPDYRANATSGVSTFADPINLVPGAPGFALQAGQAVSGYAHGGEVDLKGFKLGKSSPTHTTIVHPDGHEVKLAHAKLKPHELEQISKLPHYDEGGESMAGGEMLPGAQAQPVAQSSSPDAASPQTGGASASWGDPVPQNPTIPEAPQAVAPASGQSAAGPIQDAVNQQMRGIQQQADAQGKLGDQEAQAAVEQQKAASDMQANYQQQLQKLDKDRQDMMADIGAGHIDPQHYMNNLSTSGKLGTALGLIVSGFGAGASGQKNAAMEYLNNEIDRDIAAQKADLGRKENLLSANMRQYGNLHDAANMTKMLYTDMYAAKIAQAAAQSKSPMAQAAAQQAIGQLKAQTAPLMQEMAARQTVTQGLQSGAMDPAMAVPHLVPKEQQAAVHKEIENAQNTSKIEDSLLGAYDTARKENTFWPTLGGTLRTPASILKMRALSLPLIHNEEGKVSEFEQKTLSDLEPKPGDSEAKLDAKREALVSFIEQKKSAPIAKSYGIDLNKAKSANSPKGLATPRN